MAQTIVRDSQLRLDPIISQDPKVQSSAPSYVYRDTDSTLPLGLWRVRLEGNSLRVEKNTAVAGDFGSIDTYALFENNDQTRFLERVVIDGTQLRFDGGGGYILWTPQSNPSAPGGAYRSVFVANPTVDSVQRSRLRVGNPSTVQSGAIREVIFQSDAITRENPSGARDGINTDFTLSQLPLSNSEHVFLNGLLQDPGVSDDYTISGKIVTFNNAPISTDVIRVSYTTTT
jgi:hypothetical protein